MTLRAQERPVAETITNESVPECPKVREYRGAHTFGSYTIVNLRGEILDLIVGGWVIHKTARCVYRPIGGREIEPRFISGAGHRREHQAAKREGRNQTAHT